MKTIKSFTEFLLEKKEKEVKETPKKEEVKETPEKVEDKKPSKEDDKETKEEPKEKVEEPVVGLTPKQKKNLPPALQAAILKKLANKKK